MNTNNDILQELRGISPMLADMSRSMPYSVPDGYFARFPASVAALASDIDVDTVTPQWSKAMPYSVPEGYFSNMPATMAAIAEGGGAQSFSLPKATPFDVPAGYFDALPAQVLQKAKAADKARMFRPQHRSLSFRSISWAAAAIVLLVISIGIFEVSPSDRNATDNILASVSNNEIHDYLQQSYRVDVDRIVNNTDINNIPVDNKEIVQYLNETGWDMTE
jgi:hypothetical protein